MATKSTAQPTPILDDLIERGLVRLDLGLFVGTASDGTEVTLPGGGARPDQTEAYLRDFPTPAHW